MSTRPHRPADTTTSGAAESKAAPSSAADRVYARLKGEILGGTLPGGSFLTEGALAADTGVSRTPVREALLRLEAEGLLRLYPKKGALVVPPSVEDARDVLEARLLIEEWAARAAWPRRAEVVPALQDELDAMRRTRAAGDVGQLAEHDRRFHETLVAAAGNAVLTRAYRGLRDRQLTLVAVQMRSSRSRIDAAVTGHARIVQILRTGTVAQLVTATREHVESAMAALQAHR